MKKIILLILSVLFLSPFDVFAVTTAGKVDTISTLFNTTHTKVGDYFTVSFNVGFRGLQKNTYDTYGVAAVGFVIQMDDDFLISSISSNVWDTSVYDLGNGAYYFMSEYIEDSDSDNACIESVLYCSNYTIDVTFFVKNTENQYASIVMKSATAAFLDLSKEYDEVTEDDIITSTYESRRTVTMSITQLPVENQYTEPTNIAEVTNSVPSIKSNVKDTNISPANTESPVISDNTNLLSLAIEGYTIDFNKDQIVYDIDVNDKVKVLKINAIPESDKASVEIIGADNLEKNSRKVLIKVKAENGNTKTYTIYTKKEEEFVEKAEVKKIFKLDKKYIIIGGAIIGLIIILFIIMFVVNRVRDNKIDNILDSM